MTNNAIIRTTLTPVRFFCSNCTEVDEATPLFLLHSGQSLFGQVDNAYNELIMPLMEIGNRGCVETIVSLGAEYVCDDNVRSTKGLGSELDSPFDLVLMD